MLSLLQVLIFGHVHKWEIIEQNPYHHYVGTDKELVGIGTKFILRCSKCGNLKTVKSL